MIHSTELDFSPLSQPPTPFSVVRLRKELGVTPPLITTKRAKWLYVDSLADTELVRIARVQQFCSANNLPFLAKLGGVFPEQASRLTTQWSLERRMILYALTIATSETTWLELGEYRTYESTVDEHVPHYASYARVKLSIPLPPIVINAKAIGSNFIRHDSLMRYETESSEFNRLFELYIDKKRVHDSLSILAPDVMATLVDFYRNCDIELADGRLFVMGPQVDIAAQDGLADFILSVDRLRVILTHKTARMSDEIVRSQMRPNTEKPVKTNSPSKHSLKKDILLALVITVGTVAATLLAIHFLDI